jgi:dUTP pyrophosphatase
MFIKTGIALRLPAGYEAQIRPRSSLSKAGVHCALGTIDCPFTGELAVVLTLSPQALSPGLPDPHNGVIKAGDRIAQMVIVPVPFVHLVEVESQEELGTTERGADGWGSTGK